MEPEGSLPYWQVCATCPYPEPTLCTLWLQYKNMQKYFKQFQSLTLIT
jgi:hypothetical protein